MKKARKAFSAFSTLLTMGGNLLFLRNVYRSVKPLLQFAGDVAEKKRDSRQWEEQLYSVDILLEVEETARRKFVRLLAYLFQQGRHDDLHQIQKFIHAAIKDNPTSTRARDLITSIANMIGDSGTEADFQIALDFLAGNRVVGVPPAEPEPPRGLAKSMESLADWFRTDLQRRQDRRRRR